MGFNPAWPSLLLPRLATQPGALGSFFTHPHGVAAKFLTFFTFITLYMTLCIALLKKNINIEIPVMNFTSENFEVLYHCLVSAFIWLITWYCSLSTYQTKLSALFEYRKSTWDAMVGDMNRPSFTKHNVSSMVWLNSWSMFWWKLHGKLTIIT